jgi:hypothetical protein
MFARDRLRCALHARSFPLSLNAILGSWQDCGLRRRQSESLVRSAHRHLFSLRDFLEAPGDRSRSREELSVQLFEIVIRGEEHETAGHAHCDPDDASIELDGKTLRRHNSSPDERSHALIGAVRKPLVC